MPQDRPDARQQVGELLATAREALGITATFLTRMNGETQRLEQVDSGVPLLFQEGYVQRQERTLCQAVLDGDLPPVIPDLRKHPLAMAMPAARFPRVRSYISVPVVLSDGTLYGTFCGAGLSTDRELGKRDQALMEVLARAAALVVEPELAEQQRRDQVLGRLEPLMAAGGPSVVLQPIVSLTTGHRVGAEALSRFPAGWQLPPDVCFAQAHSVGVGDRLELLALLAAVRTLDVVDGYVSLNISPSALLTPECRALLHTLPLDRVLLELTEHDAVQDYEAMRAVLDPLRARGLRLAIDDVGAGFSSLRHIVLTAPDVLKLDRSIVAGVSHDTVLRTLVASLVTFAHGSGALVVAEGIETGEDAEALRGLGVDLGQGWFFGRPAAPEQLSPTYAVAP